MDNQELRALTARFSQGVDKLALIGRCLTDLVERLGVAIEVEPLRPREGEIAFWFAGTRYYARVRVADRSLDDAGVPFTVPVGWVDWGPYDPDGAHGPVDESSYFDDRGVVFVMDGEEVYCDIGRRDDPQVESAIADRLWRLVKRTMAGSSARRI